jgi:hypothetical protein
MTSNFNIIHALAKGEALEAINLAVNAYAWGEKEPYEALAEAWDPVDERDGSPNLYRQLKEALDERLSKFGMFSDEGNQAVAEAFAEVAKQIEWWTDSDMEEAMNKVISLVQQRGYREVSDTAVREEIWARLESSRSGGGHW